MSKDNEWISRAQREAAQSLSAEKQKAAQTAIEKAAQAKKELQEMYERDDQVKLLLERYLEPLHKYVDALNAGGFLATIGIEVGTFYNSVGHVALYESFTKEDLDKAAALIGKKLPDRIQDIKGSLDKKKRMIDPLSKLNAREEEGAEQGVSVWDSSSIKLTLKRTKTGRAVEAVILACAVRDFEYKISSIREEHGSFKYKHDAEVTTKQTFEVAQPPCVVVTVHGIDITKIENIVPSTYRAVFIAYSPEELDIKMHDFLTTAVTELELLHLKESENAPKKKKRVFGIF